MYKFVVRARKRHNDQSISRFSVKVDQRLVLESFCIEHIIYSNVKGILFVIYNYNDVWLQ